jgi:MSHA biogenesis protein MshI
LFDPIAKPMSSRDAPAPTVLAFADGRMDVARAVAKAGRPLLEALDSYEVPAVERPAALQRMRRKLGARVLLLLAPGEYQLLQTDAPDLQGDELKAALRWKVKDQLDYPVDRATLDAIDIRLEGAAAARGRQCYVVAASDATLAPKIRMFQGARVQLEVIDIPEMAQRNVAGLFETENRGLALLNFTADGGLLTFTYKSELFAVRRIEVSLEQLEQADEARRTELFDRIALEVQRSIDNFERQYNFITLSRLLTADLPAVPGLYDYLKGYLSLKTDPMDLAEVIDFPSIPELRNPRRQAECLPVIGAALREASA